MLLLAIDTAGPNCAVAVARYDAGRPPHILAREGESLTRGHAERLPPMVDAALAAASAGYADLSRIAVTTGPGSFTGVRVGIAYVRGLALALGVPALGVGSLDALALPCERPGVGTVVAALDAKRGEVYALAREIASGRTLIAPEALPATELALQLGSARRPLMLTGSGAPLVASTLGDDHATIASEAAGPDIADVVALACRAEACGPPLPLYARPADAKPQVDKAVARL